ncbi:MAG: hypothetical protein D3909_15440 [Candidatus Electrothrix sp. ATG1]|nr:hypothetical protein [Candidatus Electrothrix sp. ATG1]
MREKRRYVDFPSRDLSFCTVPVSANAARQDSDRDFLIIADHPLDREIITQLKDGLYDIELENNEVMSSIIRSRQEWS